MFDSQSDLAALVYETHQDPDLILRRFSAEISQAGFRPTGLVQSGHRHWDGAPLTAKLIGSGEAVRIFRASGTGIRGCRLDIDQLDAAEIRIAQAIDEGADVLIVNRYGKREREGAGFAPLIERALDADIPVVIAVSEHAFSDWISFTAGMSIKLHCDLEALRRWWARISTQTTATSASVQQTFCEALK